MTSRLATAAILAQILVITSAVIAAEPPAQLLSRSDINPAAEQLRTTDRLRHDAALQEFDARFAEFKAGRSPAKIVIQANLQLLLSSLETGVPNASGEYDRRGSRIEACGKRNLSLGTATKQDVTQAKSARLDSLLSDSLIHNKSSNN